ncbi:MAG TPA: hypothetical protein VEA59_04275, partial [Patescibacteria group bacterium]|nr:hypothetical protein [Patescibacteria group bacterium]
DYLFTQTQIMPVTSGVRAGRKGALFGRDMNRIMSDQAIAMDSNIYELLLGRAFTKSEIPNILAQQEYLDELHSMFLQRREDWFDVSKRVYSKSGNGMHYELVGKNEQDIKDANKLFALNQGFYNLSRLYQDLHAEFISKKTMTEAEKRFLREFPITYSRVGALIGAARTVFQARTLVAEAWKACKALHPDIVTSEKFLKILESDLQDRFVDGKPFYTRSLKLLQDYAMKA